MFGFVWRAPTDGTEESRARPDYTINRISVERAEARIKWNSYAISYIFPVCSGGCFGNENRVDVTSLVWEESFAGDEAPREIYRKIWRRGSSYSY